MGRNILKGAVILIILVVIAGTGLFFWQTQNPGSLVSGGSFTVETTDTIADVARKLKKNGNIAFETLFQLSHMIYGQEAAVVPGVYELSKDMSLKQVVKKLESSPDAEAVTIPPNVTKAQMGEILGKALGWKDIDKQFFGHTLAGMQWQRYMEQVEEELLKRYDWSQGEHETFMTLSAVYDEDAYDLFKHVYEPGVYQIPIDASRAQVAGAIVERFADKHGDNEKEDMVHLLDAKALDGIAKLIKDEVELLPDIVALPPSDVTLKTENGHTYLLFTTAYWNKGRGPLELIADPKTKGIRSDVDRKINQRIYSLDGDYRERLSGLFLWHQTHLHYHFQDFARYILTAVDVDGKPAKEFAQAKSTFCIRDSEPVDLATPGAGKAPSYTICGKERQGISSGWSDAYYYNYVDQRFDVTNAPTGQYLLTIITNPESRFDEASKENNKAEALILLNVKDGFVKVIEERHYGK